MLAHFFRRFLRQSVLPNGTYLFLTDGRGKPCGAVAALSSRDRELVRNRIALASHQGPPAHRGAVSAFVGDALAAASPAIAGALQAGQLLQVVGTPRLLEGLASGSYSLVQSSGGTLGTVVNGSSVIVGQLRFAPASLPAVAGPLIVWQVLHAIAGVRHLVKIDERLSSLQRGIQQVIFRHQARAYAELLAAIESLHELDADYRVLGRFTDDMRLRLALAERDVRCVRAEERLHYHEFRREKGAMLDGSGAAGAGRVADWVNERPEYLLDIDLFLMASRASVMIHQACLARDLEQAPAFVPRRIDAIRQEADALAVVLDSVREVEQLKVHAAACVQSLSWFRRWWSASKVAGPEHLTTTAAADPDPLEPSLVMWRDRAGTLQTVIVDCAVTSQHPAAA